MLAEIDANAAQWLTDTRVLIHPLLFCPPLPKETRYGLVWRDELGSRSLLGTGVTVNSHPPLNLAHVRQRGARLGANEVFLFPASS